MSDRLRNTGETAGDERQMDAWIQAVRSLLEGRLDLVFEQASDLEKRHLQALDTGEDPGAEGSREPALGLRVHRCGDAIVRHWYGIDGQGTNGEARPSRQACRGYADADELEVSCSVEDLLHHASGRDDAMATEVESEINQYRHWAHCIAEMLVNLERLQRLVQHSQRGTSGGEQRASRLTACEATGVAPAAAIASLEAAAARS